MNSLLVAILLWPVITYVVGVVVMIAAFTRLWMIDDDIEATRIIPVSLKWPLWMRRLFE